MILKLKRTPGIYIVGFMGCGKSTIGRILAERLGWPFADLDEDIEAVQKVRISDIFEQRGEAEFRRIETEALRKRVRAVESGRPIVLALGGGAFAQSENVEMVRDNGVSVWLDCTLEILQERVGRASHRPLARDEKKFAELFQARQKAYNRADFRIPVDNDPPGLHVDKILMLPIF
jgi:shikimate kinase